jgi:hypothetical protein
MSVLTARLRTSVAHSGSRSFRTAVRLACCALLLAGCAGAPSLDLRQPTDPVRVMDLVAGRNAAILTLEAQGSISIDSPELSNSGMLSLRASRPDSLWLEISGPFGVTAARGLVTRDGFAFYNGLDNTVITGSSSERNLRRVLRLSVSFGDMLDIAVGAMGFRRRPADAVLRGEVRDGSYVLVFAGKDSTATYTIDPAALAVSRFTLTDADGAVLEEVTFRDFRRTSGVSAPHIISVSRPHDEESLTLLYDRLSLNDYPLDLTLSVPRSARRVVL